jgi:hypothetical protein
MQISCRRSCLRPHKWSFLTALEEGDARAGPCALRPVGCMRGLGRSVSQSPAEQGYVPTLTPTNSGMHVAASRASFGLVHDLAVAA